MKKIFILSLITIVFIGNLVSQAPNLMSYQAVIWDASGNLVSEKMVSIKISILQGSVTGTSVYSETHRLQTNINGLVSLMIGGGTNASGKISDINWGGGSYFLKTETDPTGGNSYTIIGTTQLVSIPYSLFSGVAGKALDVITTEPGLPGQVLTIDKNGKFLWSGSTYPKVSTSEIFSITQNAAKAKGIILSDGGSSIKERGFVWSTEPNPNISLATKVNEELGLGAFTLTISGLKPNTKYFVRAYATNGIGTEYGELKEFSTTSSISIPIVNTLPVTAITSNGAKSGGTISSDGGTPITAKGVIWSTNTSPTILLNTKTSDGAGINSFESLISGLNQGTKYFVRAYATNSIGTSYGENIEFSTVSSITLPEVVTLAISQITENGAISGGFIAKDGGSPVINRGIVWSKDRNPTISLTSKTSNGGGTGEFSSTLIDLTPNTTYFVRAYATNSAGTSYGNELEFSVPSNPNTLGKPCSSVTEIKDINGNKYTTIQIKNQCWLKENLRVEKFNNGDQIPNVVTDRNNITYGAWISHLNDSYYDSFIGKKYNWYAATDSKGICPNGWHLPSADEWQILRNEVGDYPGPKLKENNVKTWDIDWQWGPEPYNNTQFSALGAGVNDGGFREWTAYWSTTTSADPKNAIVRILDKRTEFPVGFLPKTDYGSIRCLRNENFNMMIHEVIDLEKEKVSISASVIESGKLNTAITERGVVYGTTPLPTVSSTKLVTGSGLGKFIAVITGLKQGTIYYSRAYAKSIDTVLYSNEISFQTLKDIQIIVRDICGNTYETTKIGNQIWMAENLRTNKYNNGDQIPTVVTDRHNIAYGAWISHLNDTYYDSFIGKKYNWYAATDSRGICPNGWHLPSPEEWQILRNEVGDYPGPKLKENSVKTWDIDWQWGPGPYNNTQFSALGAGVNDGGFREWTAYWSTTTSADPKNAIVRTLDKRTEFPVGFLPKTDYGSIRCLRN